MKKFILALCALASSVAFGATLVPIQLLNPTGSGSGQPIVSTGASSAPAWGQSVALIGLANTMTVSGSTTGNNVTLTATGSDANVGINITAKGSALINLGNASGNWFNATGPASPANYLQAAAAGTGIDASLVAAGSDTNISIDIKPKGTGAVNITGGTNGSNAPAGTDGEILTATTTGTSATSGTPMNGTSKLLTAGDWDVTGICVSVPAGTTTTNSIVAGISTTSATYQNIVAGIPNYQDQVGQSIAAGVPVQLDAPTTQVNVSASTTVYLVCQVGFAVSTMTVSGYIRARRVH